MDQPVESAVISRERWARQLDCSREIYIAERSFTSRGDRFARRSHFLDVGFTTVFIGCFDTSFSPCYELEGATTADSYQHALFHVVLSGKYSTHAVLEVSGTPGRELWNSLKQCDAGGGRMGDCWGVTLRSALDVRVSPTRSTYGSAVSYRNG